MPGASCLKLRCLLEECEIGSLMNRMSMICADVIPQSTYTRQIEAYRKVMMIRTLHIRILNYTMFYNLEPYSSPVTI
jgi:hypothetical protein